MKTGKDTVIDKVTTTNKAAAQSHAISVAMFSVLHLCVLANFMVFPFWWSIAFLFGLGVVAMGVRGLSFWVHQKLAERSISKMLKAEDRHTSKE